MQKQQDSQDENAEEANENLINLPFSRNPEEKLGKLKDNEVLIPTVQIHPIEDLKKIKNTQNTYKQHNSPRKDNISMTMKHVDYKNNYKLDNTQPANNDFDYIKAPVLNKVRGPDPIAELKSIGRRDSANDDSPPFNFQGMLRKTNFKRDSMKTVLNVRRFSLKSQEKEQSSKNIETNQKNEHISFELGPELLLEGTLYDI